MSPEKIDFKTAQAALDFVAKHPTCDLVMSRRPPYPKKDLKFLILAKRAERISWQHAADRRADRKDELENEE